VRLFRTADFDCSRSGSFKMVLGLRFRFFLPIPGSLHRYRLRRLLARLTFPILAANTHTAFLIVVLRTELFQMGEGGSEVHRGEVYSPGAFHRREHLLVVLFEWASCCYESDLSINR
jgi:hypothetical protein